MRINIQRVGGGTSVTSCYGVFTINFDGTDVLFCLSDDPHYDKLELTEYVSGMRFPRDTGRKSGKTLGLDSPMRHDDPRLIQIGANLAVRVADLLAEREIKRWRILELIQMNQRKYKTNEIDF